MKTNTLMIGLMSVSLSGFPATALALAPFIDNFDAPKLDTTVWQAGGEGGAKLRLSNGVL